MQIDLHFEGVASTEGGPLAHPLVFDVRKLIKKVSKENQFNPNRTQPL